MIHGSLTEARALSEQTYLWGTLLELLPGSSIEDSAIEEVAKRGHTAREGAGDKASEAGVE